jgi:hypothetical protein
MIFFRRVSKFLLANPRSDSLDQLTAIPGKAFRRLMEQSARRVP